MSFRERLAISDAQGEGEFLMFKKVQRVGLVVVHAAGLTAIANADTIYVDDDNTDGPWDSSQKCTYQHIQNGKEQKGDQ